MFSHADLYLQLLVIASISVSSFVSRRSLPHCLMFFSFFFIALFLSCLGCACYCYSTTTVVQFVLLTQMCVSSFFDIKFEYCIFERYGVCFCRIKKKQKKTREQDEHKKCLHMLMRIRWLLFRYIRLS
jgi:hypothetical protein